MKSDVVFVLGMHRSGTSLLTRGLQAVGIELGENLLPPVPGDNDKGYFEDQRLHDLDNELLEQLDRTWCSLHLPPEQINSTPELEQAGREFLRSKTEEGVPFGLKDPRLCLLLPWWLERCAELKLRPCYVLALRHPLSVARSVCKPGTARGDVAVVKALWLWYLHLVCALQNSENGPRVVVDYDNIMDAPAGQLFRIQKALALPRCELEPEFLDGFLDRGLRHSRFGRKELVEHPDVSPHLVDMYDMLVCLSADAADVTDAHVAETCSHALRFLKDMDPFLRYATRRDEALAAAQWEVHSLVAHNAFLEERGTQLEAELETSRVELDAMRNSRSWKVTAPLRSLSQRIKKY